MSFDRSGGAHTVAGCDEAGRGCLAGPLVAAAVVLDYSEWDLLESKLEGLDDSKRLTPARRVELYPRILSAAARVVVVVRSPQRIDRAGLHKTNLEALAACLERVAPAERLLSDGFSLPDCAVAHEAVVRGDSTSAAIAAASVIAKVTRDRFMTGAEQQYPGYGFDGHAGYATSIHHDAIVRMGPTPLHRMSFDSVAYRETNAA